MAILVTIRHLIAEISTSPHLTLRAASRGAMLDFDIIGQASSYSL